MTEMYRVKLYSGLLHFCENSLSDSIICITLRKINVEKDRTCKDLTGLYEEIKNDKRDMEASATTGKTMKSTTAWEQLTISYRLDVEVNVIIVFPAIKHMCLYLHRKKTCA